MKDHLLDIEEEISYKSNKAIKTVLMFFTLCLLGFWIMLYYYGYMVYGVFAASLSCICSCINVCVPLKSKIKIKK